jgi:hypothetical protein
MTNDSYWRFCFDRNEEEHDAVVIALITAILGTSSARRNRFYLTRSVLISPNKSLWQILYDSCDEKAFTLTTGLRPAIFSYILDCGFKRVWDESAITRSDVSINGRPRPSQRSLNADGALGLVLHYLNSSMAQFTLQEIFGIVPSVCTRYLRWCLQILLEVLKSSVPEAKIMWPNSSELETYSALIRAQYPMLRNGFGFVDGLHLPVQASGDSETQNVYYNGWVHAHFTSIVFVFSPLGTILYTVVNAPGSFHDAAVARGLYQKLRHETEDGYWLIADSAFPTNNGLENEIKTPKKTNFSGWPEDPKQAIGVCKAGSRMGNESFARVIRVTKSSAPSRR